MSGDPGRTEAKLKITKSLVLRVARSTVGTMTDALSSADLVGERARAYIHSRWHEAGAAWFEDLPRTVEHLLGEWKLTLLRPMAGGRSCVLLVRTSEGEQAVLKIPVVQRWAVREAISLRHWSSGGHAPRVYATNDHALLVELLNGRSMTPWDREMLGPVAQVLAAAARKEAPPPGIPLLEPHRTMAAAARRAGGSLPERWGLTAAERAESLCRSAPAVLCHADLVPANVMIDQRGRVKLIDPEPRLAPLSYDLSLLAYRFGEGEGFEELAEEVSRAAGVPGSEVVSWGPVLAYMQCAWRNAHETSAEVLRLVSMLE